jgi:hypothetical protein
MQNLSRGLILYEKMVWIEFKKKLQDYPRLIYELKEDACLKGP